jgi:hypothetical protein
VVERDGQLLVAAQLVSDEVGEGLLVGGAERELVVVAVGDAPALTVEAISPVTTGVVGKPVPVAKYAVNGNLGRTETLLTISSAGGLQTIVENGAFTPSIAGEYTVSYETRD